MITYRITLKKWAGKLSASGRAARWNSNGQFLVYTASTRALACLENMVHRRSIGLDELFRVTLIEIPDDIKIKKISKGKLPPDWGGYLNYTACQAIGDKWLRENKTPILQVPSAIISEEYNYLLNPGHPDFARIKVHSIEKFNFDSRLFS
ncbi:RES domain-containing protein [Arachidicoccus rhizosphaerae]|uniref:RES domain-containing protein n=1 Tax=Arachidicoccus rhizosphaerae TaxID=551991 RepID=A0A1H3VIH7_9BACT|nr:RES family NAD+ phosphorylase [Arachidicoccus rhizosphaerae]SDZ74579.1 RES domain-containing protein [Arachidicoccus rhizosphaerae]